jgi:hypothetical protein
MDAFEIVRLVGASVAIVVGAIVFLVLFFRCMAWTDSWIKHRTGWNRHRPTRRKKSSRGNRTRVRSDRETPDVDFERAPTAIQQVRLARLRTNPAKNENEFPSTSLSQITSMELSLPTRSLDIQLQCGQVLNSVTVVSKEESHRFREEIGLREERILAVQTDDQRIVMIREDNIKTISFAKNA